MGVGELVIGIVTSLSIAGLLFQQAYYIREHYREQTIKRMQREVETARNLRYFKHN